MSSTNHLVDKPKYIIQAMDTHLLTPSPLIEEESGLGYQNTLVSFTLYIIVTVHNRTEVVQVADYKAMK